MNSFFLDKVALNPLSSITLWGFPGESASPPCHITDLQVSWRSWQVYGSTKKDKINVSSLIIKWPVVKPDKW